MFTKTLLAVVFLWAAAPLHAGDLTGRFEFSLAGSVQAHVYEHETIHLLNFPVRAGFYPTNNLELEVEGIISGLDEQIAGSTTLGYIMSGLVSYDDAANENIRVFFLAGYGITDTEPFGNVFIIGDFGDKNLGVLNLGAGIKAFIGDHGALRIDYRYQGFVTDEGKGTFDFSIHTLFFGVSLFP